MQIIPVIDVLRGEVVHARQGLRQHYQPIRSELCRSSDIDDVTGALLSSTGASTFYCADLDALQGGTAQDLLLARLAKRFSNVDIWLDAGRHSNRPRATAPNQCNNITPVLGTESFTGIEQLLAVLKAYGAGHCILSLDHGNDRLVGPPEIFDAVECWPSRVVVMNMDLVGSSRGPDFALLSKILRHLKDRNRTGSQIFAAGGVRHDGDLRYLAQMGCQGALVATAVHTKSLCRSNLLETRNWP